MTSYHKILLEKLVNLSDYEYLGGYTNKSNTIMNNYMKCFSKQGVDYPKLKYVCECTHWIKQNCYVRNIHTKEILVIGNCCINHFKIKKKLCTSCNEEHKRTKSNICINCEKHLKKVDKLRSTKINFGKYKGYSIGYVEENDFDYLKYIYDNQDEKYKKTNSDKIYEYLKLNE